MKIKEIDRPVRFLANANHIWFTIVWLQRLIDFEKTIDMRQPHVSNGENGYWHAAAACQQCRKWWIWPVCVEWRFQTYLSYLIVTYYTSPVDSNDIVSSLGLRRYILRQSRTGVKFLVLSRSSLNTAIWLLKMIEISLLTTINYCKTTLRDFSY